jgi:hypothetical protein
LDRLPHCWLHRRVLADLGRPRDTRTNSLRAASRRPRRCREQRRGPVPTVGLGASVGAVESYATATAFARSAGVGPPT